MPSRLSIVAAVAASLIMIPVLASAAPDPAPSAATSPSIATSISTAADRADWWSAGAITAASGTAPDRASGAANGSPTAWDRAGRGRRSATSGCAADALTPTTALRSSLFPHPQPVAAVAGIRSRE